MNKKAQARMAMLRQMSKSKSAEMHEPSIGEALKKKKMSKVTVMAPDEKGLSQGLSKAQQILKAKLGKELFDEEKESEEEGYHCDACEDEGCEECPEDEE